MYYGLSGTFKVHEKNILEQLGLNRYGVASGVLDTTNSIVSGTSGAVQGFWNEDGTGFQNIASGVSGVFSGALSIGTGVAFGLATHNGIRSIIGDTVSAFANKGTSSYKFLEAVKYNGNVFTKLENGNIFRLGVKGSKLKADMTLAGEEAFASGTKGAIKGLWRAPSLEDALVGGGRFIRQSRLFSPVGLILGVGAQIVAPMVVNAVTSVAGQMMDEAHMAYMQSTYHQYDTREFNNRAMQSWEFNKQNQIQSNMMPYEQNNMSLARLYYSR